jgi:predicted alpha/beta hydrolase
MSVMVTKTHYTATDGYALSGRHYQGQNPQAKLVIASATGVPQGFYQQFA